MDQVSFLSDDGNTAEYLETSATKIIVDSGTSYNLMPTDDIKKLIEAYQDNLGIECKLDIIPICTCGNYEWPDLRYTIDGKDYFLTRDNYVL